MEKKNNFRWLCILHFCVVLKIGCSLRKKKTNRIEWEFYTKLKKKGEKEAKQQSDNSIFQFYKWVELKNVRRNIPANVT